MKKILLAIDDDLLRKVYARVLKMANFEIFSAQREKEIFDILKKEKPDLILIDAALDGVRGLEILKKIKKKIDLPTIFFAAFEEEGLREKATELDILDFIIGSEISPKDLVLKIKKILK